jgi:hypothetical protein
MIKGISVTPDVDVDHMTLRCTVHRIDNLRPYSWLLRHLLQNCGIINDIDYKVIINSCYPEFLDKSSYWPLSIWLSCVDKLKVIYNMLELLARIVIT